jgi:hypothetical protein
MPTGCQPNIAHRLGPPRDARTTPLTAAASEGHAAVVEALLNAGAVCIDSHGVNFPLEVAVRHGRLSVVKALLCSKRSPVLLDDALAAVGYCLDHEDGPLYDIVAALRLHVYCLQQQDQDQNPGAAGLFAFCRVTDVGSNRSRCGCGLDLALLRGWCADTAAVCAGQDAAAVMERGTAAAKADARELMVQVGVGRKLEAACSDCL